MSARPSSPIHRRLLVTLALLVCVPQLARSEVVISEFMAANEGTLADEDGAYSDWIELHNTDPFPVDLSGWYLTDSRSNRTKWQFPSVTVPAGGYLVVFASNKNRRDGSRELHTNFALSADGEYLGLIRPDGVTVAFEYAPEYPAQTDNVAYGLCAKADGTLGAAGFLLSPTPGRANSSGANGALTQAVTFSRRPGPFANSLQLELSGAEAGQRIRYAIASPAAGEAAEPTASSPIYTSPLLIDASTVVRAAIFSADDSAHGPVSSAYYAKISPALAGFASNLPVIVLDSLGSGPLVKDEVEHPGWLYVFGSRGDDAPSFRGAPEVITPALMNVRGSSSAEFPKRSYSLKLTDELGKKRAQPLLGLPEFEKWALVGPWSFDFSYINNALLYSLSNQLGRWAPRTRFAEVFFNADGNAVDQLDYAGLYVLTDRIEPAKGRVDIDALSAKDTSGDALTGGYILKIDTKDADEFGWITEDALPAVTASSIVLVSPKADDVVPAQRDYIVGYVHEMEAALRADAASGWSQRTYLDFIDRASWVDFHLLNTFASNPDAFERSTYFTKPRNGKLQAGPVWDFDRALGSFWDERSTRWDLWNGEGATDVWGTGWWRLLTRDPEFMQDWIDRWQSLRAEELADANLLALVDDLSAELGAAAARDAARWPDNISPYGNYAGSIAHLKEWLSQRALWIDSQFVAAPERTLSGGTITFTAPEGAQLVYTEDGSDPRSLGGEIAPNARFATGSLTVPANSNVHVRSYREDLKDVFPGSPWSAAVGGPESSPLLPRARLINISSRAVVGSGENALIAGVVVADTLNKRYLTRAIGPGLAAFGASGVVPDPQLSVFSGAGVELLRNNGWETSPDSGRLPAFARAVGAFPLYPGNHDSALASPYSSGSYTVQITTPTDRTGIGLAELYELDANGRTVNLSTRAQVRGGEGVLIGGFVVQGPAHQRMLVRAIGPALAAFGVANALQDPVLTIYSGQDVVAINDRWQDSDSAAAVVGATNRAGAFLLPANSEDAALLITLPPGAYTVEVKGKGEAEGVALLEIYAVP